MFYEHLKPNAPITGQYKTSLLWYLIKHRRLCFIRIRVLNQGFWLVDRGEVDYLVRCPSLILSFSNKFKAFFQIKTMLLGALSAGKTSFVKVFRQVVYTEFSFERIKEHSFVRIYAFLYYRGFWTHGGIPITDNHVVESWFALAMAVTPVRFYV